MRAGPHHRPERGAGRTVPAAVEDTHLAGARTLKGPGERGCGEGSCVGSTGLQTEVVPSHPVCDTLSSNPACLLLESFLSRLRVRPACQSLSPWDYLNGVLGSASLHSLPSPAVVGALGSVSSGFPRPEEWPAWHQSFAISSCATGAAAEAESSVSACCFTHISFASPHNLPAFVHSPEP